MRAAQPVPYQLRDLFDEARPQLREPAGPGSCWLVSSAAGHLVVSRERWGLLRKRWPKLPSQPPADGVLVVLYEGPGAGAHLALYDRRAP